MSTLRIANETLRLLRVQALESYPLEVGGSLIGSYEHGLFLVALVAVNTKYKHRTRYRLACDEIGHLWDERCGIVGSRYEHIGGWHSHPDADASLSLPTHLTASDRRKGLDSDFEEMDEDNGVELIVSVSMDSRKRMRYAERAYRRDGNRHYRLKIERF